MGSRCNCKTEKSNLLKQICSVQEVIKSFCSKQERWTIPTWLYKANNCLRHSTCDPWTCNVQYVFSASWTWDIWGRLSFFTLFSEYKNSHSTSRKDDCLPLPFFQRYFYHVLAADIYTSNPFFKMFDRALRPSVFFPLSLTTSCVRNEVCLQRPN